MVVAFPFPDEAPPVVAPPVLVPVPLPEPVPVVLLPIAEDAVSVEVELVDFPEESEEVPVPALLLELQAVMQKNIAIAGINNLVFFIYC